MGTAFFKVDSFDGVTSYVPKRKTIDISKCFILIPKIVALYSKMVYDRNAVEACRHILVFQKTVNISCCNRRRTTEIVR